MNDKKIERIISSKELISKNDVDILDTKSLGSNKFCHYTTISNLDKIFQSGKIWASKITTTNDLSEKERYNENGNNKFLLCFCNSKSENIPMWYLYSGINGKGCRIEWTHTKMRKFIKSICKVHPVYDGKIQENITMNINEQFTIDYGWVYYIKCNKNGNEIKYRGKKYILNNDISDFTNNNYYIKSTEWNYEKEFRIVLTVKGKNINCEKLAIDIEISDVLLRLAPEFKNTDQLFNYEGVKKYFKTMIKNSELLISMNLIKKGLNGIIEYINELNCEDLERLRKEIDSSLNKERERNEHKTG